MFCHADVSGNDDVRVVEGFLEMEKKWVARGEERRQEKGRKRDSCTTTRLLVTL